MASEMKCESSGGNIIVSSLYMLIILCILLCFFFFFFFSSRRRHTRLVSDWSSDVLFRSQDDAVFVAELVPAVQDLFGVVVLELTGQMQPNHHGVGDVRSEERRVGKECRSRWSADQ